MKTMKISVTIALMGGLLVTAINCKKNDSNPNPPAEKEVSLQTSGTCPQAYLLFCWWIWIAVVLFTTNSSHQ